jgi:putative hydrolase of the HAD superfamily
MIRAVIFDVGGPLDIEIQHEAAIDADIRAGLAREGFAVGDALYAAAERRAVETFAPDLYRAVIWELTAGDVEKSRRLSEWREEQSARRNLFEPRPGVDAVLSALQMRGLKLGLAANQPAAVIERLAAHGLGHYFANQGVSGVYGFRKPDVRLFLRACEDLRVEPQECIMVGDRVDNDVVPAKLLGMRTVLFRTGRHRDQQPRSWDELPDAEVANVDTLLAAIDLLLGMEDA